MIEVEMVDGTAVVRLAHGKVNALDVELCRAIEETMRDLDDPRNPARAIVVTGAGRTFSAGVDLKRVVAGGTAYVTEFLPALNAAFRSVFDLGKPVIAAVNGHAIAGGCVLAAACDHRIMATGAGTIGVPELRVGVPFPFPALEIMHFTLGPVTARKMILDATNHDPRAALALGLVDELSASDALLDQAVATATRMATGIPADTFRHTKRQLRQQVNDRLDHAGEATTTRLWATAATDGRIQTYLERTIGT
jgi:enoyl-CoA hydratase